MAKVCGQSRGSGAYVTSGGVWTNASSRAYKTDIQGLSPKEERALLDEIIDAELVRFRYKREPSGRRHVGLIAEDAPVDLADAPRKGIPTGDAIGVLIGAVKAQQAEITGLKALVCPEHPEAAVCR